MLNRLTTRLILSHLLVIAIAMTLLSFVLLSLVQGYFVQAAQQSLTIQTRLVAQSLGASPGVTLTNIMQNVLPPAANAVQQGQLRQFSARVQNIAPLYESSDTTVQLSTELDIRLRVTDERGIILADSIGIEVGRDAGGDAVFASALRGQERTQTLDNILTVATPLRQGGRATGSIIGAVALSQSLNDVAAVLSDLRLRLLIAASVSLALSALVGLMLARAIARPVRELTQAAHRLARGDFDYPLDTRASGELGELARAFKTMSVDLQRTLQARTDFVANASHELRTPLTAVKGLVETLRDGAVDDLDVRDKFLASIENETDRLIRLVNDLLILSRADAQALVLRREPFDLAELAQSCADDLAAHASAHQVSLVVQGASTRVNADPDRIRQVLVNLLDNAIRYSPPGEAVTVAIKPAEDAPNAIAVSVEDRGPGIPPQEQARVFERFYRADKSRARAGSSESGAGLGLAIARTLIEAHGGHITISSSPGQGTMARFSLVVE